MWSYLFTICLQNTIPFVLYINPSLATLEIINISVSKLATKYVFSVSDNGPGIDEKYHTKIFEMFNQLQVNGATQISGIGLAIVNKIVSKNKGAISIE
jgi:light-regulated signal transduction histidine kinase (bacteriophytochrome)